MTRWLAAVAAVVCLGLVGAADGHVFRHCGAAAPAPAPAADWLGAWDWACGCWTQLGVSFAAAGPVAATPAAPATPATPAPATPPAPGPAPTQPTPRPPAPTPAGPPGKLHVLLLVDDGNPNAGAANKAGAALLEKAFRAGVPADRLGTVETLAGTALTPDRVRARILALGVRPQDALVAFYSGAVDYDEPNRAYYLNPTGGVRFPRAELRETLLARRAALTVLLTDAPVYRVQPDMLPPYQPPAGPFNLEGLLFQNRGVVDLHAAAGNEFAFPRGNDGGLFTLAVADELRRITAGGAGPSWPVVVDRVKATTDRMYVEYRRAVLSSDKVSAEDRRAYREQAHQTPTALTPLDQVKPAAAPAGAANPVATRPAATGPRPAEITVYVPAGAKVFVEERPTTLTGPVRHFETAELLPGRAYTYAIRAEQDRGGRAISQTKRVTVRAGDTAAVRFEWPY